ncbi:lamin tail domain-containing protein [Leadbettera azotonutricia]|uniref:Putative lipoprotein n=1 Tax=Leadbettera azotonutricia (strain ATCC BAA-888 / DSM 13862 / ZAS-9) TaxID=545695 RepID=F5YB21_LEAAZ|nr:lamin tail domain-containing protein [Leadbettera azotonutricia]AEF83253.1 putative lipoprotein [Leadbettera azotonutricia ZAS-9]
MKNYRKIPFSFIGVSIILNLWMLIGCSGILDNSVPVEAAKGRVLPTISADGEARTLLPQPLFSKYELTFTAEGKSAFTESYSAGQGIDLEPGTWTITARGFVKVDSIEYEAVQGSKTVAVEAGVEYPVAIILNTPAGTGNGRFTYELTFPTGITAQLTMKSLTDTDGTPRNFTPANNIPVTTEFAAGYYLMTIILDKGVLCTGKTEVVHIYPKMETKIVEAYTVDDFTAQIYLAGTVHINVPAAFDSIYVRAYSDAACLTLIDDSETTGSDNGWNMKIPADPFYDTLYFRVELADADGTTILYSAAESRSVSIAGNDDINLSFIDLEGRVLILQAYGTGIATDGAVSHSFVELYNTTDSDISLDGSSLQYGEGATAWQVLDLAGTIKAKASFLVLGEKKNKSARLDLSDKADLEWEGMAFDNRNFKIALIGNTAPLTVANPFDIGGGIKVPGYIDLLGVKNSNDDTIDGYETNAPSIISKQKAARRKNLTDTNDNKADFEGIDYRASGTLNVEAEFYSPKNTEYGPWNPVYQVPEPEGKLLILQVYGDGSGAVSRSFIELYNNTDNAIDLSEYSLQYSDGGTNWTKIDLTGRSIPSKASFLILGKVQNTGARLVLPNGDADLELTDLVIDNHNFKVCLVQSTSLLTVANPFDIDGSGNKATGYVDMIGAINTASDGDVIDGYETAAPGIISKQKAARRKNLTDTDNNTFDFVSIDYRASGISNADLVLYRPKNTVYGPWNPVHE